MGAPITVEITLGTESRNRQAIQSAEGTTVLETISGELRNALGLIRATVGCDGQVSVDTLKAKPGHYRLAVYGKATFLDGTVKPFVRRSRFFHVGEPATANSTRE